MTSQDYNLLVSLLKIYDQYQCKKLITEVLCNLYTLEDADHHAVEDAPLYTYVPGNIPVMLVAHCDTVCYKPVERVGVCPSDDGKTTALTNMEQAPLGADDRAGIFLILKIVAEGYRPHILLTLDEEIGGRGALAIADELDIIPDVKFILELDRQGSHDAAMYECDNAEFITMLETYGFQPVSGTFSDICFFAPDWDIAAANLSVGYYHEHTPWEMLVVTEMEETLKRVKQILDNIENFPYYKFEPLDYKTYRGYSCAYGWDFPGAYDDINLRAEACYAAHQKEKKKKKGGKKKN